MSLRERLREYFRQQEETARSLKIAEVKARKEKAEEIRRKAEEVRQTMITSITPLLDAVVTTDLERLLKDAQREIKGSRLGAAVVYENGQATIDFDSATRIPALLEPLKVFAEHQIESQPAHSFGHPSIIYTLRWGQNEPFKSIVVKIQQEEGYETVMRVQGRDEALIREENWRAEKLDPTLFGAITNPALYYYPRVPEVDQGPY